MSYNSFRNLDVWKVSMELVASIYRLTADLPSEEKYGLVSQMRRCAVSIPSNIAEGQGRGTAGEARQFTRVALGSLAELETQLLLTAEFYQMSNVEASITLVERVRRMLARLHSSLSEGSSEYSDVESQIVNRKS